MRTVHATRYVMPFREGGSVPALVESDDLGLYVVKLRGAGQGEKALIAELVSGEVGRALGLLVPELVLVELDPSLSENEPDPELSITLRASAGTNVGLDYLPGSITFDALAGPFPDAETASRIVLFDAFMTNVDRTPRNPNLLGWHRKLWLIDHGASLYLHHGWDDARAAVATPRELEEGADDPFVLVKDHVLLSRATSLRSAAAHLSSALTDDVIDGIVAQVPASWLETEENVGAHVARRNAYTTWLRARRKALPAMLSEAEAAHARVV